MYSYFSLNLIKRKYSSGEGEKSKDKSSALNEKTLSSPIQTFKRRALVKTERSIFFGQFHDLLRLSSL